MLRLSIALVATVLAASSAAGRATNQEQQLPSRIGIVLPSTQPMPSGSGRIAGQIVDSATARPIDGAVVTLTLADSMQTVRMLSDDRGAFQFGNLPVGKFNVTATMAGYAAAAYTRVRAGGPSQPIELAAAEQALNLRLDLFHFAAVAGTVIDSLGEPIVGATVQAFRRSIAGGRWTFARAASDTTDDRGAFRIADLDSGGYIVGVPLATHSWPASLEHYMLQGAEWPTAIAALPDAIQNLIGTGIELSPSSGTVFQTAGRVPPAGLSDNGHVLAYVTQFHPNASTAADAALLTLGPAEVKTGLLFTLVSNPTRTVSGTVTGRAVPLGDLLVTLTPSAASGVTSSLDAATAITDARGRFTFAGVAPGQYRLAVAKMPEIPREAAPAMPTVYMTTDGTIIQRASSMPVPPLNDPVLSAELAVTVGGADVTMLAPALRSAAAVRGRAEFVGAGLRPTGDALKAIAVMLEPANGGEPLPFPAGRGRVDADGQVVLNGAPPGRYVIRVAGATWSFASAILNGRDVSIEPFELGTADVAGLTVAFTDQPAKLAGTVSTPAAPATGATSRDTMPAAIVIAFPTLASDWVDRGPSPRRLLSAKVARSNTFTIGDVPPGDYFVAAIADADSADWQDPAFLAVLSRVATRVEVTAGQMRQISLALSKVNGR